MYSGIAGAHPTRCRVIAIPLRKTAARGCSQHQHVKHGYQPSERQRGRQPACRQIGPRSEAKDSDVSAGVAVDFHADADFDDAGSGPAHTHILQMWLSRPQTTLFRAFISKPKAVLARRQAGLELEPNLNWRMAPFFRPSGRGRSSRKTLQPAGQAMPGQFAPRIGFARNPIELER